ncbi:hypothetical protein AVEN_71035-1 [Araneus ventricosus]|uniref:Uncharacterized protein n=1 Tax=Araneus ventricosus TaxID=182803 RepID=A0A4Y2NU45_ARAVE|nr:hypothetical protein AVEN_71035-1 [Araneus ventricosus]
MALSGFRSGRLSYSNCRPHRFIVGKRRFHRPYSFGMKRRVVPSIAKRRRAIGGAVPVSINWCCRSVAALVAASDQTVYLEISNLQATTGIDGQHKFCRPCPLGGRSVGTPSMAERRPVSAIAVHVHPTGFRPFRHSPPCG